MAFSVVLVTDRGTIYREETRLTDTLLNHTVPSLPLRLYMASSVL